MSEIRRRRPWLAAALALVVSGLGHAYLRRWARAFGWYVVITATLVFLVPDAAVDAVFAGEVPPLGDIAPAVLVVAASVVDAYVVAVRNNREYERHAAASDVTHRSVEHEFEDGPRTSSRPLRGGNARERATVDHPPTEEGHVATPSGDTRSCPHCGREADVDLDFCQWCAEPLDE